MLKPVENRGYNAACHFYEKKFIDKINQLKDLPTFPDIEKFAQKCLDWHTGFGYLAIAAQAYMELVDEMDIETLTKWGKSFNQKKDKE